MISDHPKTEAKNWKKQAYADIAKEDYQQRACAGTGYASYPVYRPNMSREELCSILDFKNGETLPRKKADIVADIERFLKKPKPVQQMVLDSGKHSELVELLAQSLRHKPRVWLTNAEYSQWPKEHHRFGLSFQYLGPYVAADGYRLEGHRDSHEDVRPHPHDERVVPQVGLDELPAALHAPVHDSPPVGLASA